MKRLIALVVFFGVLSVAFGQDIQPVKEYPLTVVLSQTMSISATPSVVASLTNRRFLSFVMLSSGTAWIGVGTTTAAVGAPSIPVYYGSQFKGDLAATIPVSIVCSANATGTLSQGY